MEENAELSVLFLIPQMAALSLALSNETGKTEGRKEEKLKTGKKEEGRMEGRKGGK